MVVDYAHVSLEPSQINVSTDASTATTVTFSSPIYLQANLTYAIVLLAPTTNNYLHWIARMGEATVDTQSLPNTESVIITNQYLGGSLFRSQNGSIWTANQFEDMKLKLNKCSFTSTLGTLYLYNPKLGNRNAQTARLLPNSITTLPRKLKVKIDATNNRVGIGLASPDKMFVINGADAEVAIDDTNDSPQIRFRDSGSTKGNILSTSGEMVFQTGGSTEGMRLDATQRLGIQDNDPLQKLHIAGVGGLDVATLSSSSTGQQTVDSFSASQFRTAKYLISITNSTDGDYQALELLLFHDGTTVYLTQYASIFDNGAQATFDADINSCLLYTSPSPRDATLSRMPSSA